MRSSSTIVSVEWLPGGVLVIAAIVAVIMEAVIIVTVLIKITVMILVWWPSDGHAVGRGVASSRREIPTIGKFRVVD